MKSLKWILMGAFIFILACSSEEEEFEETRGGSAMMNLRF